MDDSAEWPGEPLMHNTSEWPNDAREFSLSQVLEVTSIPPKYCLSPIACAGLIPRQNRRPCLFVSQPEVQALSMIEKLTLLHRNAESGT